jgi:hypothetical protein
MQDYYYARLLCKIYMQDCYAILLCKIVMQDCHVRLFGRRKTGCKTANVTTFVTSNAHITEVAHDNN